MKLIRDERTPLGDRVCETAEARDGTLYTYIELSMPLELVAERRRKAGERQKNWQHGERK